MATNLKYRLLIFLSVTAFSFGHIWFGKQPSIHVYALMLICTELCELAHATEPARILVFVPAGVVGRVDQQAGFRCRQCCCMYYVPA